MGCFVAFLELGIELPAVRDISLRLGHAIKLACLSHVNAVADELWILWYALNFDPVHPTRSGKR